jgi:ABC-type glycerol-3-phosphate transport system substrate-binding protein
MYNNEKIFIDLKNDGSYTQRHILEESIMNKLITLLVLITLIPFIGFSGGAKEEALPEKLVYLTASWGAPSQELLDKFEAQTGIEVEVSSLSEADLRNKVMTAAAGKTSPADVIFTGISNFGVFGHSES